MNQERIGTHDVLASKAGRQVDKMAQWVQVFAASLDNLSLIPSRLEGKNRPLGLIPRTHLRLQGKPKLLVAAGKITIKRQTSRKAAESAPPHPAATRGGVS